MKNFVFMVAIVFAYQLVGMDAGGIAIKVAIKKQEVINFLRGALGEAFCYRDQVTVAIIPKGLQPFFKKQEVLDKTVDNVVTKTGYDEFRHSNGDLPIVAKLSDNNRTVKFLCPSEEGFRDLLDRRRSKTGATTTITKVREREEITLQSGVQSVHEITKVDGKVVSSVSTPHIKKS